MNDIFNEQKDTLLSIKREINLLQQQVDFLIRNEKPLALLDLDVLMNRTHTLYDLMCGVEVKESEEANQEPDDENQELPVGVDEILSMFAARKEEQEEVGEEVGEEEELDDPVQEEEEKETPDEPEENEDAYFIDEANDDTPDGLGFVLNFEPIEEKPEEEKPVEEKPVEEKPVEEEIVYEPVVIGNMEDHDDGGFEFETPETLGERYQQNQEETVGERFQHNAVGDLQKAIGINDKFLFVNELFAGSMEKYNRSIENLNDLKTLNGALIYLNELRIELQWNSNNEAYKKLLELVHRKYEA